MKLLFDIGNTRVKWGVVGGGRIVESGAFSETQLSDFFVEAQSKYSPSEVAVANVSRSVLEGVVRKECNERWGVVPVLAEVKKHFGGVTVAYEKLEKLGVDRWLALLGAWQKTQRACVVIDAGSAITVDCLGDAGQHLGGLIAPGVEMMVGALFQKTASVKVEGVTLHPEWQFGDDTELCVEQGLSAMVKGFVNEAVSNTDSTAEVIVSGGDAAVVSKMLSRPSSVHPLLVMEGLMCVS